jgi:hypothetical protein
MTSIVAADECAVTARYVHLQAYLATQKFFFPLFATDIFGIMLSDLCICRSTRSASINAEHISGRVIYRYRMNNYVAHRTSYSATVVMQLKRDVTRADTRFRLSAKRTSPFKWVG